MKKQEFCMTDAPDNVRLIMVENHPTSGYLLRNEQVGVYFWNRIHLTRPCTVSELEEVVRVAKQWEAAEIAKKSRMN